MSAENLDEREKTVAAGTGRGFFGKGQNRGRLNRVTSQMTQKNERRFFANEGADPLTGAFSRKSTVHAGTGGKPVDAELIPELWEQIASHPREDKSVAYFHIPFCHNRCLYCGFYKYPASRAASRSYTDAMIRELHLDRKKPALAGYAVSAAPVYAVYLGGGTPRSLHRRTWPGCLKRSAVCCRLAMTVK